MLQPVFFKTFQILYPAWVAPKLLAAFSFLLSWTPAQALLKTDPTLSKRSGSFLTILYSEKIYTNFLFYLIYVEYFRIRDFFFHEI